MGLKMESPVSDTSREVHDLMIEGYRAMPPWKKLRIAGQLTCSVQRMALARIRAKHGTITEKEERLRLASLWLDGDTMRRVFQWDPDEKGF